MFRALPGTTRLGSPELSDVDDIIALSQGLLIEPGSIALDATYVDAANPDSRFLPRGLLVQRVPNAAAGGVKYVVLTTAAAEDEDFKHIDVAVLAENVPLGELPAAGTDVRTYTAHFVTEGHVWEDRIIGPKADLNADLLRIRFHNRDGLYV